MVKLEVVMVDASIASLKVAVTRLLVATPVAPEAGNVLDTLGAAVSRTMVAVAVVLSEVAVIRFEPSTKPLTTTDQVVVVGKLTVPKVAAVFAVRATVSPSDIAPVSVWVAVLVGLVTASIVNAAVRKVMVN